MLIVEEN